MVECSVNEIYNPEGLRIIASSLIQRLYTKARKPLVLHRCTSE